MKHALVFTVLLALSPAIVSAHPLGDAALDMEPGEWRELPTENMAPTMDTTNGGVPEYGDSGAWDSNTDRFFVHGQGHEGGTGQFRVVSFDAETNRWDALPQPGWYGSYPHQISHPNDHNTIDPDTGTFYMRPFQFHRIYSYDIAAEQWGELPPIPGWDQWANCCGGLVHFPEMGALVLAASGEVVAYDYAAQSWSNVASGVRMGGWHNFAEYSPGAGAVILGGGPSEGGDPDGDAIHRLDPDGTITELAPAPFALGTTATVTTVDPVSGVFLVLAGGGTLHAYDVDTETWLIESEDAPLPVFNTLAAPIPDHGVIMFAYWDTGDPGSVYLYKMSPFTPPPNGDTGGSGTNGGGESSASSDAGGDRGTGSGSANDGDTAGESGNAEGPGSAGGGTDEAGPEGCGCRQRRNPGPGLLLALCPLWLVRRRLAR